MSPEQPTTRVKETIAELTVATDALTARLNDHVQASQETDADPLDIATARAVGMAIGALQAALNDVERAGLAGDWTSQRALDALAAVDGLDPQLVPAIAAAGVPDWVEVKLPRGGTARVTSRAVTEAQPGFVVSVYGDEVQGPGTGPYATSLIADDDDRLRELITLLHGDERHPAAADAAGSV